MRTPAPSAARASASGSRAFVDDRRRCRAASAARRARAVTRAVSCVAIAPRSRRDTRRNHRDDCDREQRVVALQRQRHAAARSRARRPSAIVMMRESGTSRRYDPRREADRRGASVRPRWQSAARCGRPRRCARARRACRSARAGAIRSRARRARAARSAGARSRPAASSTAPARRSSARTDRPSLTARSASATRRPARARRAARARGRPKGARRRASL